MGYSFEESGAFVDRFDLEPTGSGPLDGMTFAVKDLIDVAGRISGCGNPTWRETHRPAPANAVCVDQLLAAGARSVGKTLTDQLAFGLDGENYFYGTPINPRSPNRVPGGSSSGSASAVACDLVDFALGTDTGGSVRIPANNCGIFGLRPSHDRVSLAGVMPFAPTYDTVGVLAREAAVLDSAARVLLGCEPPAEPAVGSVHLISECMAAADNDVRDALQTPIQRLRDLFPGRIRQTSLRDIDGCEGAEGLDPWFETFRVLQWAEIWNSLGGWVEEHRPEFGPRTENNFNLARTLDRTSVPRVIQERERLFRALDRFLGPGDLLCMPTAPAVAPIKGSLPTDRSRGSYYPRTVAFVSISGIGRLPQVNLPVAASGDSAVGLGLLGKHGADAFVLDVMSQLTRAGIAR